MRILRVSLALLVLLETHTAHADACVALSGEEPNAVLALAMHYQNNCLGLDDDTSRIAQLVRDALPTIDVSEKPLRSSTDLAEIRKITAGLLTSISQSLARVPRGDQMAPTFAAVQRQLNLDREKVLAGGVHAAEPWKLGEEITQASVTLLGDQVNLALPLNTSCGTPRDITLCRATQTAVSEIVRYSTLIGTVLFESNAHIPALTEQYSKLDKQWDYYFEDARSQYIWELAFNAWRFDKQLVKSCKAHTGSNFEGPELELFCKRQKDVRLSPPPRGQWILLHPTAAIEYASSDDSGDSSTRAVAIVELIGYNLFANKDHTLRKWPIGASLISTVSLDTNGDRFGYGMMLHLNNSLSLGVARRKFDGEQETTWLLSADLGKLLSKPNAAAKEAMKFLDW